MKKMKHFLAVTIFMAVVAIMPHWAHAGLINSIDFTMAPVVGGVNFHLNSVDPIVDSSISKIVFKAEYKAISTTNGTQISDTTVHQSSDYTYNNTAGALPQQGLDIAFTAPGINACTKYNIWIIATVTHNTAGTQTFKVPSPVEATSPALAGQSCTSNTNTTTNPTNTNTTSNPTNTNTTSNPTGAFSKLENPLPSIDDIPDFIKRLVDIAITIGVPIVALAIIYSGFLLVTARGNPEKLKKGKQAFLAAIIGGAILLGAWVIANAIDATINQIRS